MKTRFCCSIHSLTLAATTALLATFPHVAASVSERPARPNIVVIMVDDMGFSDIGCYGGEIDTPNLDRMAANGLRFSSFYNAGRCCPTRASLLTGLYPHRTGLGFMTTRDYGKPGYTADLNRECVTIAEVLRPHGYGTYLAGKWHVCHDFAADGPKHNWPLQRGFDKFYGTLIAAGSQWNPLTLADGNQLVKPQGDFYYTETITRKAVEFITSHPRGKPFFLYVAHTSPHWPLHARKGVIEKYRGRFAEGWDVLRRKRCERLLAQGILAPGTRLSPRDATTPAWSEAPNKEWEQSRMEAYAAMIDHVDQGVGQILDTLKTRGQLSNTLVLFFSDNGGDNLEHMYGEIGSTGRPWAYMRYVPLYTRDGRPVTAGDYPGIKLGPDDTYGGYGRKWANVSNAPFRKFKKYAHEGGISTPLIAHWPDGIDARGELRHQVGHVVDIMATCLDIAGATYPDRFNGQAVKALDGVSLVPLFKADLPIHDALFWEHHGNRGVRCGKWKLVAEHGRDWELYDMQTDRTETTDLAATRPDVVGELDKRYGEWAARSDVLPRDALVVKEILESSNPLTRSPEEMKQFLRTINKVLEARGQPTFELEE